MWYFLSLYDSALKIIHNNNKKENFWHYYYDYKFTVINGTNNFASPAKLKFSKSSIAVIRSLIFTILEDGVEVIAITHIVHLSRIQELALIYLHTSVDGLVTKRNHCKISYHSKRINSENLFEYPRMQFNRISLRLCLLIRFGEWAPSYPNQFPRPYCNQWSNHKGRVPLNAGSNIQFNH